MGQQGVNLSVWNLVLEATSGKQMSKEKDTRFRYSEKLFVETKCPVSLSEILSLLSASKINKTVCILTQMHRSDAQPL